MRCPQSHPATISCRQTMTASKTFGGVAVLAAQVLASPVLAALVLAPPVLAALVSEDGSKGADH